MKRIRLLPRLIGVIGILASVSIFVDSRTAVASSTALGRVRSGMILQGDTSRIQRSLSGQEGTGPGWCSRFGGYTLGAQLDGVYACGPATGNADPFDSVGFQCVELSARFLWVAYGKYVTNVPDGKDFVHDAHRQLHVPVGVPSPNSIPAPGDIVSLGGGIASYGPGHTGVVTSVRVGQNGNGRIHILEQNASPSGLGEIRVRHWAESYGSGYYGYDVISWLELSGQQIAGPPGPNFRYAVQALGPHTWVTSVNDAGSLTGLVNLTTGPGSTVQRPFRYSFGRLSVLPAPAAVGPLTQSAAINDSGQLALSAETTRMPSAAFVVSSGSGRRWKRLPNPFRRVGASAALSINDRGDVAGWFAGPQRHAHSLGVVWKRVDRAYRPEIFWPTRGFVNARLYASDRLGDAVGTETSLAGEFYPAVWLHGGTAHRLPSSVGGTYGPGSASAIRMGKVTKRRALTIVGSSDIGGSSVESTAWKVLISGNKMKVLYIRHLGMISQAQQSVANALNGRGWVVGDSIAPRREHAAPFAFLLRPKEGMLPLSLMMARDSQWTIDDAEGINAYGQVAAEGYRRVGSRRGPTEGLLLTPTRSR